MAAVLGVVGLAAVLATWHGVPWVVVLPVATGLTVVVLAVAALVVRARRALRHASDRIDTILREELDRAE